ncbi:MAG TPA: primosomal protein [Thermotogota bacterium]|nr:primosomal protein [Thermotogota bacterium]
MKRQLLTEWIPFENVNKNLITESINNGTDLILTGVMQRANAKNHNGRIYPFEILDRELQKYKKVISENRALGELDHPESYTINLSNVSHMIVSADWNDKQEIIGKVKILNTPSGNIIKNLLAADVLLGISSRGIGSVEEIDESTTKILDDFELICWDFVSTPSTQLAYMKKVNENVLIKTKKINKVNNLINDIISGFNV